jgi:hypothetical protein
MAGAAHSLHATGDGRRRLDLHHKVYRTHIDSKFERRCGYQPTQAAEFQAVFDFFALRDGHAAVVRANERFAGKIIYCAGNAFGQSAIIHKDERRAMRADQRQQLRMNGAPD